MPLPPRGVDADGDDGKQHENQEAAKIGLCSYLRVSHITQGFMMFGESMKRDANNSHS